mmetsp:Transcript_20285/g.52369  ORF Transcript_20285/g.52369 Transcript_20285/m.52369 type:complete len:338 (+) Transcript_20285:26-1039(+)
MTGIGCRSLRRCRCECKCQVLSAEGEIADMMKHSQPHTVTDVICHHCKAHSPPSPPAAARSGMPPVASPRAGADALLPRESFAGAAPCASARGSLDLPARSLPAGSAAVPGADGAPPVSACSTSPADATRPTCGAPLGGSADAAGVPLAPAALVTDAPPAGGGGGRSASDASVPLGSLREDSVLVRALSMPRARSSEACPSPAAIRPLAPDTDTPAHAGAITAPIPPSGGGPAPSPAAAPSALVPAAAPSSCSYCLAMYGSTVDFCRLIRSAISRTALAASASHAGSGSVSHGCCLASPTVSRASWSTASSLLSRSTSSGCDEMQSGMEYSPLAIVS